MISRIEAYRYRCFYTLDLQLDRHHVFAGSNGTGKTTLLDIPALLGDLVSVTDINEAFFNTVNGRARSRAESAHELVHKLDGDNFYFAIEVKIPKDIRVLFHNKGPKRFRDTPALVSDTIRYEIAFKIEEERLNITEEHLILFKDDINDRPDHGKGIQGGRGLLNQENCFAVIERSWRQKIKYRYEWEPKRDSNKLEFAIRDNQTALGTIPADSVSFPVAFWFREYLLSSAFCYEPQWPVMRLAASPRDRYVFRADGGSLPWQVFELQERDPQGLAEWTELVQMALPVIKTVAAKQREDDSYCYLLVTYNNGMQVPSTSLSHGTLHILALTIIPYISNPPNVLTLEEPENGIHPKAIDTVLEALSLSDKTQLFMSTHAPIVLANTDLQHIITMRINSDGATEVLKGTEHPRLKEWKGEVDLGTLFAAGVLE